MLLMMFSPFAAARRAFLMIAVLLYAQSAACGHPAGVSDKPNPPDRFILEMYTESRYSVYPPGRILNIKVYESGHAEYDHYPVEQGKEQFSVKRERFSLTPDELQKLKDLTTRAFTASAESYEPTVPILDAAIESTLVLNLDGNQRKIRLVENHSNLILEKKKGVYPESLLNLLLFIQEKNDKLLGIRRQLS